jgi:hypothetical protein
MEIKHRENQNFIFTPPRHLLRATETIRNFLTMEIIDGIHNKRRWAGGTERERYLIMFHSFSASLPL